MSAGRRFRPAKPWGWVIAIVESFVALELFWRNRVRLAPADLALLRALPDGAGVILAANHADETDIKVCMELSRRWGRRFLYMMNSEAFDECRGIAGWWLQRLGAFSVERGGSHNETAKRYAIEAVMRGREALVIFPEGEIYYLNDLVQPFKSGVAEIGMQAELEARRTRPEWSAYVVPMAFKYLYRGRIETILERRTRSMENHLNIRKAGSTIALRLAEIMANRLSRHEMAHQLKPEADRLTHLGERVQEVRRAILTETAARYSESSDNPPAATMDRAWRLSSYLRGLLAGNRSAGVPNHRQVRKDLASTESVAEMAGWQPQYTELDPSQERLAETVIKLEREVYGTKRPRQLARRELILRIGGPVDLGGFVAEYDLDAHKARGRIAERLRDEIQRLLESAGTAPLR